MALGYNANLPNGDLEGFLNDMNEEKASYSDSEEEGLDELYPENEAETEEDYENLEGEAESEDEPTLEFDPQMASLTADFAAMLTDIALPSVIALIIKVDPEKLQATKEQYNRLVTAYANYLKTKKINLSPGWMLVAAVVTIYGAKIPAVLQEKKLKEKEEELDKREKELAARILEFEKLKKE